MIRCLQKFKSCFRANIKEESKVEEISQPTSFFYPALSLSQEKDTLLESEHPNKMNTSKSSFLFTHV